MAKRKKKVADFPATEREPALIAEAAARVMERAEAIAEPAQKHEPEPSLEPKRREPTVFVSVDKEFRLLKDGNRWRLRFAKDPGEEVKQQARDAGFHYSPAEQEWQARDSYQMREDAQRLAVRLQGKETGQSR